MKTKVKEPREVLEEKMRYRICNRYYGYLSNVSLEQLVLEDDMIARYIKTHKNELTYQNKLYKELTKTL